MCKESGAHAQQTQHSERVGALADTYEKSNRGVDDNDNDHSSSQLPVNKSLTFPKGQSAWAVAPPRLAKETRSMHKVINQGVPLRSLAA